MPLWFWFIFLWREKILPLPFWFWWFASFLFSEFLCWEHWVRCRAEAVRERDPSLVPDCNSEVFRLVLSSVVLDVGFSEMTFTTTVRHFLLFLIWWLIIVMSNYPTIEIVIHFVLHSVNPYEHYWFLKINLKLHDFAKCFYDSYCISTSSHEFSVCEVISFHLQVEDSNSSILVFSTTVRICGPNSPVL